MIQNLNQLKKSIKKGTRFDILKHCRHECVGQQREVTLANTRGFYSIVPEAPESKTSLANNRRGAVLWWGKAPFWEFHQGICSLYSSGSDHTETNLVIAFRISS